MVGQGVELPIPSIQHFGMYGTQNNPHPNGRLEFMIALVLCILLPRRLLLVLCLFPGCHFEIRGIGIVLDAKGLTTLTWKEKEEE